MAELNSWLERSAVAARQALARPDLWLAGALASLPVVGWLPFALAILPRLGSGDLVYLGVALYSSGGYPWNVMLLALAAALLVVTAVLLASIGQAAVLRGLSAGDPHPQSLSHDAGVTFSLSLVSGVPFGVALAIVAAGLLAIVPEEVTAPDLTGPLGLRIVARLAPWLLLAGLSLSVGLATGADSIRRSLGPDAQPVGHALRAALADLRRHPLALLGSGAAVGLVVLAALGAELALLRVLWAPIQADAQAGQLLSPGTLGLLAGFVALWLGALIAAGIIAVWSSAWWTAEVTRAGARP